MGLAIEIAQALEQMRFTFAAYNAGPGNVAKARRRPFAAAAGRGLHPLLRGVAFESSTASC
ncbi:MAG: hypothetical protein QNJ30_27770 [Kiloniellales bacterium]|nr:hypothetical protein [Kiloniellales bacterium]